MEKCVDVNGYENLYQVSNCGRVRSKDRQKKCGQGVFIQKGRLLKSRPNSRGYMRVQLVSEDGERTRMFVHRLVALHFVENTLPELFNVVNHLDCDFHNNNSSNLEWTTQDGNRKHAAENGRMNRTKEWLQHLRETNEKNGKSVVGTNIQNGDKVSFVCLNDCRNKGFQPSCVCNCCKGKAKTHKGYEWHYAKGVCS